MSRKNKNRNQIDVDNIVINDEPIEIVAHTSTENKESKKVEKKSKVVAVPCVTKDVKALDLIAEQHGYAINIKFPKH